MPQIHRGNLQRRNYFLYTSHAHAVIPISFYFMTVQPSHKLRGLRKDSSGISIMERAGIGILYRQAVERSLLPGPIFEDFHLL